VIDKVGNILYIIIQNHRILCIKIRFYFWRVFWLLLNASDVWICDKVLEYDDGGA